MLTCKVSLLSYQLLILAVDPEMIHVKMIVLGKLMNCMMFSREVIQYVITMCKNKAEIACQILVEQTPKDILNVFRA